MAEFQFVWDQNAPIDERMESRGWRRLDGPGRVAMRGRGWSEEKGRKG